MTDVVAWFNSIPFFTRWWFGLTAAVSLLGRMGLFSPMSMIWSWKGFINQFQLWRPFTAVFYYPISPQTGFHFLMNLYFLYNYSMRLETGIFSGKPADYFYMLLFVWLNALLAASAFGLMLLMDVLVIAILYVWCIINKDVVINFWFGTQFKAMMLPWVLLAFNFAVNGRYMEEIAGIFIGHLYYFLKFKYPLDFGGPALLKTPQFLLQYFPQQRPVPTGFAFANQPQPPPTNQRGHNWGQGQMLGGN